MHAYNHKNNKIRLQRERERERERDRNRDRGMIVCVHMGENVQTSLSLPETNSDCPQTAHKLTV